MVDIAESDWKKDLVLWRGGTSLAGERIAEVVDIGVVAGRHLAEAQQLVEHIVVDEMQADIGSGYCVLLVLEHTRTPGPVLEPVAMVDCLELVAEHLAVGIEGFGVAVRFAA